MTLVLQPTVSHYIFSHLGLGKIDISSCRSCKSVAGKSCANHISSSQIRSAIRCNNHAALGSMHFPQSGARRFHCIQTRSNDVAPCHSSPVRTPARFGPVCQASLRALRQGQQPHGHYGGVHRWAQQPGSSPQMAMDWPAAALS